MHHIGMKLNLAAAVLALFLQSGANFAQQQQTASAAPQNPVMTATGNEVMLDVVVRDKKGRPVRDLEPSQFAITDNGEPVKIQSLRLIDRSETAGNAEAKTGDAHKLDPLKQIRLFTLLFERLGQDGRLLARRAALDLIKGEPEQNTYYAVFAMDQRLSAIQQFTNDRALL